MVLKAEQHSQIAAAYETAAAEEDFQRKLEQPSLKKQIGFVCLPGLEKKESERH
jgi:hypothetical protein